MSRNFTEFGSDGGGTKRAFESDRVKTMKRSIAAVAFLIGVACALPETADAQYHGVTHHRVSRRASRVQRPGWSHNHGQQGVPELDPRAAGAALALLLGGFVVLRGSRSTTQLVHS